MEILLKSDPKPPPRSRWRSHRPLGAGFGSHPGLRVCSFFLFFREVSGLISIGSPLKTSRKLAPEAIFTLREHYCTT